jgi:hypothetical protein
MFEVKFEPSNKYACRVRQSLRRIQINVRYSTILYEKKNN